MKSKGNTSNLESVNTFVDKENTPNNSNSLHTRNRAKQKYNQNKDQIEPTPSQAKDKIAEQTDMENFTDEPFSLSKRLENIKEKLSKLQSLKDDTINELSNILKELNELVPILNQFIPLSNEENLLVNDNESGLSRLLNRLHQLQFEYQKRRSVSEKRFSFRIKAIDEKYAAEVLQNKTESNSELAESSVASIHKHMTKTQTHNFSNLNSMISCSSSLNSLDERSSENSSVIAARKRSLPAINQPLTARTPSLKIARRQSVAAYPQNVSNNSNVYTNNKKDHTTNSSVLNFDINSSNILMPSKSFSLADSDLLTIKSRISKSLKR